MQIITNSQQITQAIEANPHAAWIRKNQQPQQFNYTIEQILADIQTGKAQDFFCQNQTYQIKYRQDNPGIVKFSATPWEFPEEPQESPQPEIIDDGSPISSSDPDAIAKLKLKLANQQALQDRIKAANKLVRKNDKAGLAKMGYSQQQIEKLFTPDFAGRIGYADYKLKNNYQDLRRIKQRIEELEAQSDWSTTRYESSIEGIEIEENVEDNRIRLIFDSKPSSEIRKILKQQGFRWSPNNQAWQRMLNQESKSKVEYVLSLIEEF